MITSVTVRPSAAALAFAASHSAASTRTDRGGVCVSRMSDRPDVCGVGDQLAAVDADDRGSAARVAIRGSLPAGELLGRLALPRDVFWLWPHDSDCPRSVEADLRRAGQNRVVGEDHVPVDQF